MLTRQYVVFVNGLAQSDVGFLGNVVSHMEKYCKDGFTKHNKHATCIMIVCCFLCHNIARMGLQNTTNT